MGKGKFNNLPWGGGKGGGGTGGGEGRGGREGGKGGGGREGGKGGGAGGYLTKRLVLIYHGERGVELEILVVSQ